MFKCYQGYVPRFNWDTKFHEESHQLDYLFSVNGHVLTHPTNSGQQLLDNLNSELVKLINIARAEAGRKDITTLDYTRKTAEVRKEISENSYAILDWLQRHYPTSEASATAIDALGLCTHGKIDRDSLGTIRDFTYERRADGSTNYKVKKYGDVRLFGHDRKYNKQDDAKTVKLGDLKKDYERHHFSCDDTLESFANLTSSRWCRSDVTRFNEEYLSECMRDAKTLMGIMITRSKEKSWTWIR